MNIQFRSNDCNHSMIADFRTCDACNKCLGILLAHNRTSFPDIQFRSYMKDDVNGDLRHRVVATCVAATGSKKHANALALKAQIRTILD
jgi:hypothetical protein